MKKVKDIGNNLSTAESRLHDSGQWTAVIADCIYGIKRFPIGEGVLGVGKIGDKLLLEYIFRALQETGRIAGTEIRIVLPYAEGFDLNYPQYGPCDLFYPATVPTTAGHIKARAEMEEAVKAELRECAGKYGVILLPIDKDSALREWCGNNVSVKERIIHVQSGQGALNVNIAARMMEHFRESKEPELAANGHDAGLTPVLYTKNAWEKLLENHKSKVEEYLPAPGARIAFDDTIERMAWEGMNFNFRHGMDVRLGLIYKLAGDISAKSPQELYRIYRELGDEAEYECSSGRTFKIFLGDRLKLWKNAKVQNFHDKYNNFISEAELLKNKAGFEFDGKNVLEIGCGAGELSILAKLAGAEIAAGTDFSVGLGSPAQRRFIATMPHNNFRHLRVDNSGKLPRFMGKGFAFMNTAGENLPFKDESFHLVFSKQVLEHVTDPLWCMQEMMRVTKKKGIIYLQYGPYFNLKGGHGACTTDIPWGHVILTGEEMEEYVSDTEFPQRGKLARYNLNTYFNPQRLYLHTFERFLENIAPVKILYYDTPVDDYHSEMIDENFLKLCRVNYPEVTMRDLLVRQVTAIFQKL